ncbi:uncharacterized protein N7479_008474 [Penicillium vulpinum]|uniref:uncharacterized protein n=1 Tax=Penicillium vulpinum TaxID=29845 RepID=UPI002547EA5B|nr:uncharacterized protein N7479_008474 [Penicillium vulpinum]KAJ5961324.1 hypothetical protein N7479_008474 [Penicillium vulpinum]
MEQLSTLARYFERAIIPLCDFSANIEKLYVKHMKLSETIIAQVTNPGGDMAIRNSRRALIKQSQHPLNGLDAAKPV